MILTETEDLFYHLKQWLRSDLNDEELLDWLKQKEFEKPEDQAMADNLVQQLEREYRDR